MFDRLARILLLIAFSLASSVGPHWHQHAGCGCAKGKTSPNASVSDQVCESGCALCQKRVHEESASHEESEKSDGMTGENGSNPDSHEHSPRCAICKFYAQCYIEQPFVENPLQNLFDCAPMADEGESPSMPLPRTIARGPPLSLTISC
jgi:hypothetical protein